MSDVIFIDTSILLCIINVPGKSDGRDEVVAEFSRLIEEGALLILPMASIIETGNHIAQLSNGYHRRERASVLQKFILDSVDATPPWVVGETKWDGDLLRALAEGIPGTALGSLSELASTWEVGAGDATIVHEALRYKQQTHVPSGQAVRVWSLDSGLVSVSESVMS